MKKIGIIGAGQMGGYYANNLVAKCDVPAADVICHDRNPERAHALGQKFGITVSDSFPTGLGAAIVAVNTPSHHEVIARLVKAGVRHILCEKPLAQTPAKVEHIAQHAGSANIYTALVINFSPALTWLQKRMDADGVALLDFYGRWGKNRGTAKEKRPTPGDLEDEAIHPIGVMLALGRAAFEKAVISARVGWIPYVNRESQTAARMLDDSFPERPNHSTSANIELQAARYHGVDFCTLQGCVHSSFLLAQETRTVGGLLGHVGNSADNEEPYAKYAFEIAFDQKRPEKEGGAVDRLKLVDIRENRVEEQELSSDKLNDLTRAFLEAVQGGKVDPRLVQFADAKALVLIADAILCSSTQGCTPQIITF